MILCGKNFADSCSGQWGGQQSSLQVNKAKKIHLAIAPEGTRKAVRKWKTGFHTIAKECDIPVYLGYFDWKTKRVGRGNRFEITDDARADMQRIQEIYEQMHMEGKHKEGYVTH